MNGIKNGDVVVGIPDDQSTCPNDHSDPEWIVDDTHVGRLYRVTKIEPHPCGCILLYFRDHAPHIGWCAGSFRPVEPGKIPTPANVRELEPT